MLLFVTKMICFPREKKKRKKLEDSPEKGMRIVGDTFTSKVVQGFDRAFE